MARLTLTDADATFRRWLGDQVQKLGCTLHIDQMGNMFARQKGRLNSPAPMIVMGSHLDTQPRGGRYDGILGIMAALEVLRTMKENGFQTGFDVGLVNWTKYVHLPIDTLNGWVANACCCKQRRRRQIP
jgi:acetylornithine deacetylase/succinyl-diaminopimelate desuccinylase-like protein